MRSADTMHEAHCDTEHLQDAFSSRPPHRRHYTRTQGVGEPLLHPDSEGRCSNCLSRLNAAMYANRRKQEFPSGTREEFIQNCKAGHYDDVVAIYRSNVSNQVRLLSLSV